METEEERKKQLMLFDDGNSLDKKHEEHREAMDEFADTMRTLLTICRQNAILIPDPDFIIEFEVMIMYMSRAYR